MKTVRLIILLGIAFIAHACDWVKTPLGGNIFIIEGDQKNDVAILYIDPETPASGQYVVPSQVLEYNFDEKWIIAKSVDKDGLHYWIVNKDSFSVKEVAKNRIGPIDSIRFYELKAENGISLDLKKYIQSHERGAKQ